MRYMMLIYSKELAEGPSADEGAQIMAAHIAVMREAQEKGALQGAEPLTPSTTATTVRVQGGRVLLTDGPFAETKEQLAGFYILDCANLDEAIDWAAKIPTGCKGAEGCIEIRALPGVPTG
jgi:hypothetical protein